MGSTLVILAAGLAVRFGSAKQIQSVGPSGETIIDYSIFDAIRVGFGEVLLVVSAALPEEFRERMIRLWADRIKIRFVVQPSGGVTRSGVAYSRPKPWGTGHAVLAALSEVSGNFALINADDFYGQDSFRRLAAFLRNGGGDTGANGCLVGFRLEETLSASGGVSRGVARCFGDNLAKIEEFKNIRRDGGGLFGTNEAGEAVVLTGSEPVSMNMWGFRTDLADQFGAMFDEFVSAYGDDGNREFYLPSAVTRLIADGTLKVEVIPTADRWFGLTYREDLALVRFSIADRVRHGHYPKNLFDPDIR